MKDTVTIASTEEIENLKIPNIKKCTRDFLFFSSLFSAKYMPFYI